jgi:CRISPR-associated protein Cas5d
MTPPDEYPFPALRVLIKADTACFTRAEFPSERVSYAVPTPSALIGTLSSVFWKPQFRWVVESVDVLLPIRWLTQQRNEVGRVQSLAIAAAGERYDATDMRVQRQTLMLRDVAYRVHAHIWQHPEAEGAPAKWRDQFNRRVHKGAYFRPPYLGMREHVADVLPDDPTRQPIASSQDLGLMLHTIAFDDATGAETYTWFRAQLESGSYSIPRQGMSLAVTLSATP